MLTRRLVQLLMAQLNNLNVNTCVQNMVAAVNCVLSPSKERINPIDTHEIKKYFQATKKIEKDAYKLDISVSNAKDIVEHVLILANKYG